MNKYLVFITVCLAAFLCHRLSALYSGFFGDLEKKQGVSYGNTRLVTRHKPIARGGYEKIFDVMKPEKDEADLTADVKNMPMKTPEADDATGFETLELKGIFISGETRYAVFSIKDSTPKGKKGGKDAHGIVKVYKGDEIKGVTVKKITRDAVFLGRNNEEIVRRALFKSEVRK